jgi:hypothetical protein
MVSYDTNARIEDILKGIEKVIAQVDHIIHVVKPAEELWDNSDIIRNWKVSDRTIASWRRKGIISFVQVNGKIWYPREARDSFLKDHMIKVPQNIGGENHGNR